MTFAQTSCFAAQTEFPVSEAFSNGTVSQAMLSTPGCPEEEDEEEEDPDEAELTADVKAKPVMVVGVFLLQPTAVSRPKVITIMG